MFVQRKRKMSCWFLSLSFFLLYQWGCSFFSTSIFLPVSNITNKGIIKEWKKRERDSEGKTRIQTSRCIFHESNVQIKRHTFTRTFIKCIYIAISVAVYGVRLSVFMVWSDLKSLILWQFNAFSDKEWMKKTDTFCHYNVNFVGFGVICIFICVCVRLFVNGWYWFYCLQSNIMILW